MKKIILALTLILIFTCLFVVGISAKEYSPKTTTELNSALTEINASNEDNVIYLGGDGANYTTGTVDDGYVINCTGKLAINLVSDITLNCRLKITSGDVVINLNNFKTVNTSSRGGNIGSQFYMTNADSTLEIYNGGVEINDVCFWPVGGEIIAENVTLTSKEETVWTDDSKTGNKVQMTNCTISANLFCQHKGGCRDGEGVLYLIDGCTINTNVLLDCPREGSYFKNSTVKGYVTVDSYHKHNGGKIDTVIVENVTSTGKFSLTSGGATVIAKNSSFSEISVNGDGTVNDAHMQAIDCKYNNSISIGDKSSKTSFTDIKTATCETAGSKTVYTSKNLTKTVDEQYAIDNPKTGHIIENPTGVHYDNYFEMGKCTGTCKYCGTETAETNPSLPAFITSKGFSTFNDNGVYSVTQGFTINKDVAAYFGEDFDYGILATVNAGATEIAPKLEDQNVVFASLCGSGFVATSIKLTNITNLEQKVVYCMYVKLGDNLVYLNNGTTSDTTAGLSYNDVESILSK